MYLKMQENYSCLPSDIDEQFVEIIIDQLNLMIKKENQEQTCYIDEIIP